jgi:hypothetical protein
MYHARLFSNLRHLYSHLCYCMQWVTYASSCSSWNVCMQLCIMQDASGKVMQRVMQMIGYVTGLTPPVAGFVGLEARASRNST